VCSGLLQLSQSCVMFFRSLFVSPYRRAANGCVDTCEDVNSAPLRARVRAFTLRLVGHVDSGILGFSAFRLSSRDPM
jgi:hypothetical protein